MAQASGLKTYNTFVRGIITEAGPLTFPENASIGEDNFVLNHDGSRQRRLGLDYEDNYQLLDTGVTKASAAQYAISSHHWSNVADNVNISFSVIQFGYTLYIFDSSKIDITSNFIGSVDFSTQQSTYSTTIGEARIQTAYGAGIFLITSKEIEPFYLSYDADTDTFQINQIDLKIRDFFGLKETVDVGNRPTTLTTTHKYNLYNQGWPTTTYAGHINEAGTVVTAPAIRDPIAQTYTTMGYYPSNADMISSARKDTTAGGSTYIRYYEPDLLAKFDFGNTPAASGHFILDAFNRSASRASESGVVISGSDYEQGRPQTTAFFAGRAFYSGIESNSVTSGDHKKISYSGFIFFSKIIQDLDDLGKCYQEADPTSEDISDVLATDGGTIHIPNAGRILKLVPRQNTLIVIADNGVWTISGGEFGFRATEFQVSRVTNIGAISDSSIISAEGNIVYWGEGGIYALAADQVSLQLSAANLSEGTIQTLYNSISNTAKIYCTSTFNPSTRELRWLYNDTDEYDGSSYRPIYNRELIYDSYLKAFSSNTIAVTNPQIAGYVETTLYKSEVSVQDVVIEGDPVVIGADQVTISTLISVGDRVKTKYLTLVDNGTIHGVISEFKNTNFLDWYSYDSVGQDYTSYLITGYELAGEAAMKKQTPYLITYFKRTEDGFTVDNEATHPSSCLVQARWNFSDSTASGQWGPYFQAYRLRRNYITTGTSTSFDYGYNTIITKSKLRGSGHSLSILFTSETGKDLHLYGWTLPFIGRTNV
jgi:hypothetical protein